MPKASKKTVVSNNFLESLQKLFREELRPIREDIDGLEDHLNTKIRLSDQSTRTSLQLTELKLNSIEDKLKEIGNQLDGLVGMLKNHHEEHTLLSQGHKKLLEFEDEVKKLKDIHPKFTHASL